MIAFINLACWWIGAIVLVGGAWLVAAGLITVLHVAAVRIADHRLRRLGYTFKTMRAALDWRANGSPEWKLCDDKVYRMVPTAGPYEIDSGEGG